MQLRESDDGEFEDCLRAIASSSDPAKVRDAWNSLEEIASANDCNRNYDRLLRELLAEGELNNVDEVPKLLDWFSKFPFPKPASNPISDDIARFLHNSARDFKNKPDLMAEIIRVINGNHEKYLPHHNNHTNLCKSIVEVLSWIHVPEKINTTRYMYNDIKVIVDFLKMVCKNKAFENVSNISSACFMTMCEILLSSDREEEPSSALVFVIQLVDDLLWQQYMLIAVQQILDRTDKCNVVKMLNTICQWLVKPPHNNMKYLSIWLTLFLRSLEELTSYNIRIVMEVADITLPFIFAKSLMLDEFYEIDIDKNVILLLLARVRTMGVYHKLIKIINPFLSEVEKPLSQESNKEKIISAIINITQVLLKRFQEHLNGGCYQCRITCKLILHLSNDSNPVNNVSEEMEISYPSTSSGIGRVDTDKVGLLNLGNTCYMNSVLQALVMTRQLCREVLLYKTTNELSDQTVLKNLQTLFAQLKYSAKGSLAPTEILRASRPAYFMPGQQQDSSEFLCHLLDVLYEQEKSALMKNVINSSSNQNGTKVKAEDKEMEVDEVAGPSNSPVNEEGTTGNMTRWITEENLSEGANLQRKTQSLADFAQGEELAQTQNGLSDSHSDSTDSGIQSVGGEDSTSSSASSASSPSGPGAAPSYLVHRVFGGELRVIYACHGCGNKSHNTDQFRDLQLCFLDNLEKESVTVQDLINANYTCPETLDGDNMYRCDKCNSLQKASRFIKFLQAPAHLILTLKHFRYDSESRLRTKLRRKVIYDSIVTLPVLEKDNEKYELYAAVVHSGYSMDYGHYITYACDAKNRWYKFNDGFVTKTTLEDFKRLQPPDTPYILFYKRCTPDGNDEDAPEITSLSKNLQTFIEQDRRKHGNSKLASISSGRFNPNSSWDKSDDDDDKPPPNNCRDALNIPPQHCLY